MKEESQSFFQNLSRHRVIYTGIGKVNASYALTKALAQGKPDLVLNFGTAGSPFFKTHELIECNEVVQRDMDLTGIGLKPGITPFDKISGLIRFESYFPELKKGVCGTGDSFEMSRPKVECNIVDMEAYALAKICRLENIPFSAVKYVTDGSDHNAHNDWQANLPKAAAAFWDVFSRTFMGVGI